MSTPTVSDSLGDVAADVTAQIPGLVAVAAPVMVALAGISIAIGIFRKFGLKR